MHYSQPLKIKFGTNKFLGLETLEPIQYRERVKKIIVLKKITCVDWPIMIFK